MALPFILAVPRSAIRRSRSLSTLPASASRDKMASRGTRLSISSVADRLIDILGCGGRGKTRFREEYAMPSDRITPCLWFDDQAEEAATYYTGIFKNSRITQVSRYGEAGKEVHGRPVGSVMTVAFELDGQSFTALNGGPVFKFNEAISLQVTCKTQEEVDHYWTRLSAGGDEAAQRCGWLKDKFGVSWQIVPAVLPGLLSGADPAASQRAMKAMLTMKKLDIPALERAYRGRA
jgi:predicted 3-demethylubiquinone-9 3-methyltransferase (glyoxalase superfamily)